MRSKRERDEDLRFEDRRKNAGRSKKGESEEKEGFEDGNEKLTPLEASLLKSRETSVRCVQR